MRLFRVADPASSARHVGMTGAQVVVVWGLFLGLLPAVTVAVEDELGVGHWGWDGRAGLGLALFAGGSAVGLWSAWTMAVLGRGTPIPFDAASELVVAGPYRVVRNPMAVSAIVQLLGVAAAYGSAGCVGLAIGGGVVWHVVIRPPEERFLADRFGEAYRRYQRDVPLWLPTLSRRRPPPASTA